MKIINKDFFSEVEEQYENNQLFVVGRHALSENKISDLTYVKEQEQFVQNMFSIDLNTLPALNQEKSRRCWIFAGLDILRNKIAKDYNLEDFKLSANFLTFYDKLEKSNFFMETMIELINEDISDRNVEFLLRQGIRDGGYWQNFINLINKYGVVPSYSFPETYQSQNTSEMNQILNKYLRKFTIEIRKNKNNIDIIKKETLKNIYNILCTCLGVPPKTIDFEYVNKNKEYKIEKKIKPINFLNKYINININNYGNLINYPSPEKPFYKTFQVKYLNNMVGEKNNIFLNIPWERLEELMVNQLKGGEVIYFSCDNGKYMNKKIGIWNEKQYDYDTLFQIDTKMDKADMLDTRECYFGHTLLITGVDLEDNYPTKWKIKNSWGEDNDNKGFWVATNSWMQMYVYQASINYKYMTQEEIKMLKQQPIELDLWDSLAELI